MHVIIDPNHPEHTTLPIDTAEQIEEAQRVMRDAGIAELPVSVGEPEDEHPNGQVLRAHP